MRLLLGVLLIMGGLAGCLSDDVAEDPTTPAPQTESMVFRFDSAGNALPVMGNATTRYHYTGHTGAEPNMGITSSGALYVTAFEDTIKSEDNGETWESVHQYRMFQGQSNIGTSDPMLWVDTDTDRIFVNHMWGLNCYNMLWSDDEGSSWMQRDLACFTPVVDHQKVVTGPPGPEPNPQAVAMAVYPNVVYTCYNKLVSTDCFASFDGGLTYTQEAVVFNGQNSPCWGASGHPAVAPDGTIALAHGWNCGPVLGVSRDNGLTWDVLSGPTEHGSGASIDPDITFTQDGTMFLLWRGADHYTYLARSTDMGQSWDGVWSVTAPGLTSTRFHVVSSGDGDKLALSYLGTDRPRDGWAGAPIDAPADTAWHLYIVTVEDALEDPVFTAYKVTPDDDPVQKGCAWEGGGSGGDRRCRNMLDFIDSAVAPDGTFYVTYTEGCTIRNECAGNWENVDEMDARDREVAVAALDGWSLNG